MSDGVVVWKRCKLFKRKKEDGYEPVIKMVQRFIPENGLGNISIAKFRCKREYKRFTSGKCWTVYMHDKKTWETLVNQDFSTFEEARALADTLFLLNN